MLDYITIQPILDTIPFKQTTPAVGIYAMILNLSVQRCMWVVRLKNLSQASQTLLSHFLSNFKDKCCRYLAASLWQCYQQSQQHYWSIIRPSYLEKLIKNEWKLTEISSINKTKSWCSQSSSWSLSHEPYMSKLEYFNTAFTSFKIWTKLVHQGEHQHHKNRSRMQGACLTWRLNSSLPVGLLHRETIFHLLCIAIRLVFSQWKKG